MGGGYPEKGTVRVAFEGVVCVEAEVRGVCLEAGVKVLGLAWVGGESWGRNSMLGTAVG